MKEKKSEKVDSLYSILKALEVEGSTGY